MTYTGGPGNNFTGTGDDAHAELTADLPDVEVRVIGVDGTIGEPLIGTVEHTTGPVGPRVGTVEEVLAHVGQDPALAARQLAHEVAHKNRPTLVRDLNVIADDDC